MKNFLLVSFIFVVALMVQGCENSEEPLVYSSAPKMEDFVEIGILNLPDVQPPSSGDGMFENVVKEVHIQAKNWEFVPSEIRVKQGEFVKLIVKTLEGRHGIAIPSLGIEEDLNEGETVTLGFWAEEKGAHPFHCSVYCGGGHADMSGVIIVEE